MLRYEVDSGAYSLCSHTGNMQSVDVWIHRVEFRKVVLVSAYSIGLILAVLI